MYRLVVALIASAMLAAASPAQSGPIPVANAIESIRFFRAIAVDRGNDKELLSFCQIKEAFDREGNLKRDKRRDPVPFATRAECDRSASPDQPLADGVYFESVQSRGDTLVFRASRKYGEAFSTQEYRVVRIGPGLQVVFSILSAFVS